MICCFYELSRYYSSRGLQRTIGGFRQGDSRRSPGAKSCSLSFNPRRSEARLDCGCSGFNPYESEPMGASSECERLRRLKGQDPPWKAISVNASDCQASRGTSRAISSGVWVESGAVGRPNLGRALKAPVRYKTESAASPEVDASTRISFKTGQLFLSSGSSGRGQAVSPQVKKNFKIWVLGRRLSFRMRQVLLCIPGWDGDGRREGVLCAFPPPANIASDSIFRAGWRRFWGGMGLYVRSEGIEKAS